MFAPHHTGLEDGFDYESQLIAGAAGYVGGQAGKLAGNLGAGAVTQGAVGAVASDVTRQGANIVLGRQESFSWRETAVAGVGGGISGGISASFGGTGDPRFGGRPPVQSLSWGQVAAETATRLVGGIATQTVGMLLDTRGSYDFAQIAANAFGTALGNSIVGHMQFQALPPDIQNMDVETRGAFTYARDQGLTDNEARAFALRANGESTSTRAQSASAIRDTDTIRRDLEIAGVDNLENFGLEALDPLNFDDHTSVAAADPGLGMGIGLDSAGGLDPVDELIRFGSMSDPVLDPATGDVSFSGVAAGSSINGLVGTGASNESVSDLPFAERQRLLQQRLDALRADETIRAWKVFDHPDKAAAEILDITAPLSREYGIEIMGHIKPTERGGGFQYTIPSIAEETGGYLPMTDIGYHTHPYGDIMFSNYQHNNEGSGIDAVWVAKSEKALYVGTEFDSGEIGIAVCEPGNCDLYGRGGTEGRRVK